jgi:hypothetical protein
MSLATTLSRALVRQPQRSALSLATRAFPGLLRSVASHTRLAPEHQLAGRATPLCENTCTVA